MSRSGKIALTILSILVLISLGFNILLYVEISRLQQRGLGFVRDVRGGLPQAISKLEAFEKTTIQYKVQIKQEFPVQAEIPFNETLDIPIQLTVPISQEIKTTVMIDPLNTGLSIPVEVNVPVDLEIPIDTTLPISIERTIPISTTIPLDLDVPLNIVVSETELAPYLAQLRTGLIALEQALARLEQ